MKAPFKLLSSIFFGCLFISAPVYAQKNKSQSNQSMELLYVYDALCGWCFGFSRVIEKLQSTYGDNLHIDVISGGLIRGERVGPYGEFANYIKNAIPQLEQTSGVKIGDPFIKRLDDPNAIQDSKPPALALAAFRSIKPTHAIDYAHKLQKSHFIDGNELNDISHFAELATEFGIDIPEFQDAYNEAIKNQWDEEDFRQSAQLGVRGFPALFIKKGDKYIPLANGYVSFTELQKRIN